jgi:hypothetical protein
MMDYYPSRRWVKLEVAGKSMVGQYKYETQLALHGDVSSQLETGW